MEKCIACHNRQKKYFNYLNFEYFKCTNCGLVSTYPLPSKIDIKKHYKEEFKSGNYKFLRQYSTQYQKIYSGFLNEIITYLKIQNLDIKNKKILDIGCFTGEFLILASKKGAIVTGVELQEDAVKIANKKLPGRIIKNDVSNYPFGNKKFDIITMFGLIEHVEEPQKLIRNASKILTKNGVLVIQTPNSGSFISKATKKYWPPYTPIEHIHLFNKNSLKILFEANGIEMVKFKNHFKILPIAYVYNMLDVFGPEIKKVIKKIERIYDPKKSKISLPFYVGEMLIIARKK